MPERATKNASASVPVARADASTVYGIPSASAVSRSSSKTRGWIVEPRVMTGPLPSGCLPPTSLGSMPGASVACVTSTTTATCGSSENAVVLAPAKVISSCTTATPATAPGAPPASATARAAPRAPAGGARGLGRDVRAEPVVHRAGGDAVVGELDRVAGDHRHVTDADQL